MCRIIGRGGGCDGQHTISREIRVISLGYGVQSTVLAVMSALGDLDRPEYIIHSDTLHERQGIYAYARWLNDWLAERGVEVITVQNEGYQIGDQTNNVTIPAFTTYPDGTPSGMLRRQCTDRWKIAPIRRFLSTTLENWGLTKTPGRIEMWLGKQGRRLQAQLEGALLVLGVDDRNLSYNITRVTKEFFVIESERYRDDLKRWKEVRDGKIATCGEPQR